jgi:signal transduction histidine kinase
MTTAETSAGERSRVPLTARQAPAWVDAVIAVVVAVLAVLTLLTTDVAAIDPGLRPASPLIVAVTAVGALGVGLRRRAPLPGLLIVGAAAMIVSISSHYTALLPYLTLFGLYSIATHGTRRQAGMGAAVVAACFITLVALDVPDFTLGDLFTSSAVGIAAAALGDAVRLRRAHQQSVMATAQSRAEAARAEAGRAVAEERLRIARELHDVVAHSMSLIAVQAGVGAHLIHQDPGAAERALNVIADTSREALAQARSVIGLLRSSDDDAQPSMPGLAALESLVQGVRESGLVVDLRVQGSVDDVPAAVNLAAYRIVQEALTNAVRHAPARPVSVRLTRTISELRITVDDDPSDRPAAPDRVWHPDVAHHPDPAPVPGIAGSGYGLVGLRERASAVGGEFTAGPTESGGFRLCARLPVAGAA